MARLHAQVSDLVQSQALDLPESDEIDPRRYSTNRLPPYLASQIRAGDSCGETTENMRSTALWGKREQRVHYTATSRRSVRIKLLCWARQILSSARVSRSHVNEAIRHARSSAREPEKPTERERVRRRGRERERQPREGKTVCDREGGQQRGETGPVQTERIGRRRLATGNRTGRAGTKTFLARQREAGASQPAPGNSRRNACYNTSSGLENQTAQPENPHAAHGRR